MHTHARPIYDTLIACGVPQQAFSVRAEYVKKKNGYIIHIIIHDVYAVIPHLKKISEHYYTVVRYTTTPPGISIIPDTFPPGLEIHGRLIRAKVGTHPMEIIEIHPDDCITPGSTIRIRERENGPWIYCVIDKNSDAGLFLSRR